MVSDAALAWDELGKQIDREAEYNGTLRDILRGIRESLDEGFMVLSDEDLSKEDEAEVSQYMEDAEHYIVRALDILTNKVS
jgi:phosphosulfolactate synthase (CoM biosynthesis protein A)